MTAGGAIRLRSATALVVANMTGDELHASLDDILALWTRAGPLVLGGMRSAVMATLLRKPGA